MDTTSGYSFLTGETLNVQNVYQDARFNVGSFGVVDKDLDDLLNPNKCGVCCIPLEESMELVQGASDRNDTVNDSGQGRGEAKKEESRVFGVVEVMRRTGISKSGQDLLEEFSKHIAKMLLSAQAVRSKQHVMQHCASIRASMNRYMAGY